MASLPLWYICRSSGGWDFFVRSSRLHSLHSYHLTCYEWGKLVSDWDITTVLVFSSLATLLG